MSQLPQNFTYPKEALEILLLEGVHQRAIEAYQEAGYSNIRVMKEGMNPEELSQRISETHILGIRSRTQMTEEVLSQAKRLLAIGCYCIGTNQVDTKAAKWKGIPVYNAPYANTRSVAEWTIGCLIALKRGIQPKSIAAHRGEWQKTAKDSYELRGKTLGIIGYGNIGQQVGVLAESMGLNVLYYDPMSKLPLGNALAAKSLEEVLSHADAVTIHVPQMAQTNKLISAKEIKMMKDGSCLMNASRGSVVDLEAVAEALKSEKLSGVAIDVFPEEPKSKDERFVSVLQGMENAILTPHIGGSTQEAQESIGAYVSQAMVRFCDTGETTGAVNFPQVSLPPQDHDYHRILHVHRNTPGILSQINDVLAQGGMNVAGQYLQTDGEVGYVVIDIDGKNHPDPKLLWSTLQGVEGSIRTRILF